MQDSSVLLEEKSSIGKEVIQLRFGRDQVGKAALGCMSLRFAPLWVLLSVYDLHTEVKVLLVGCL